MNGVRVLEVAQYVFVPAAGAILADWGAEVIKVEHPVTGDGFRGLGGIGGTPAHERRHALDHANRGKKSIGIDLAAPAGRELLYELVKGSDVFLTNFLPSARARLEIDLEHIRAQNARIIYVRGHGVGDRGAERDRGGYDAPTYWMRGGSAEGVRRQVGSERVLNMPSGAYGDSLGAVGIAAGIAGALFGRERTGEPSVIDVSLLSMATWAMGASVNLYLSTGIDHVLPPREGLDNPLIGDYLTADGRLVYLCMLQGHEFWADLCRHLDRPDLVTDERFATPEALRANAVAGRAELDAAFSSMTLAQWKDRLATVEGVWAPVQNVGELAEDPQVAANGYIASVVLDDGSVYRLANSPVTFDGQPPAPTRGPELGEHTDIVLSDLGYRAERIAALRALGAIG
jgi:crotonobetainyl-CoA:carnitine CoA-transferase CaiB-like acyl-CoA transferase